MKHRKSLSWTPVLLLVLLLSVGCGAPVTKDNSPETFRAGDHCEIPAGCLHSTKVGPEGVAYMVGKAYRRSASN